MACPLISSTGDSGSSFGTALRMRDFSAELLCGG